ncbi:helix-turn-helix domain-containing protein [Pontimicrobium sp. IMCC45349]|uniref:helix-turn-helix domain-containing protein n=1 Tax=Pontimicrobium sp. IMCC45349 TaxID=3391574 RepID=UPI0039A26DD3
MKQHQKDKEELSKQVGLRIKEVRAKLNMQQQTLAAACNFEKSNMARIETGRVNITLGTLLKIANALDVPLKDLLPD